MYAKSGGQLGELLLMVRLRVRVAANKRKMILGMFPADVN